MCLYSRLSHAIVKRGQPVVNYRNLLVQVDLPTSIDAAKQCEPDLGRKMQEHVDALAEIVPDLKATVVQALRQADNERGPYTA